MRLFIITILLICNFAFLYHINNNDFNKIISSIMSCKYIQKDNSAIIRAFNENNGNGNAAYELFNYYFNAKQYDKAAQVLHAYCLFVENPEKKKHQMSSKQTKNLIKIYKKLKTNTKYRKMTLSDRYIILSGFELLKGNPQEADKDANDAFSEEKEKYALTLAKYMVLKEDYRKANYYYKIVVENDSNDLESLYILSEIETTKLKQYSKALTNCLKLMREKYRFYDSLALALECCLQMNYEDKRLFTVLFSNANIQESDYDKFYIKLAETMLKKGKYNVAKLITDRVLMRNYYNLDMYFKLIELYTRNNLKKPAEEYFEKTQNFDMTEEQAEKYNLAEMKIKAMK